MGISGSTQLICPVVGKLSDRNLTADGRIVGLTQTRPFFRVRSPRKTNEKGIWYGI